MQEDAIVLHARWVVEHPGFEGSERLGLLLVYLVQRAAAESKAKISQKDIAVNVLGADCSFDPAIDAHARIEVTRLRKALDLFYAKFGQEQANRIVLIKGAYCPELRPIPLSQLQHDQPIPTSTPLVAIAEFQTSECEFSELSSLIAVSSAQRCHESPVVRSGLMCVQLISQGTEADVADAARHIGANIAVCGNIFRAGNTYSIFVTVLDLDRSIVCLREAIELPPGSHEKTMIADKIAKRVAGIVADPILGIVPKMLANRYEGSSFTSVMKAYEFISTQNASLVGDAVAGLNSIRHRKESPPLVRALLSDMSRVSTNMQVNNYKTTPDEILEVAESAYDEDRGDASAQLAYGYALLNSGNLQRANLAAQRFSETTKTSESIACDARLLLALSSNPASIPNEQVHAENKDFFMDEIAGLVTLIRGKNYSQAACLISKSNNGGIFWLHLLGAAVYAEVNEHDLARRSANRVKRMLPRVEKFGAPMLSGFFPDAPDREFLVDNIRRSGIRI